MVGTGVSNFLGQTVGVSCVQLAAGLQDRGTVEEGNERTEELGAVKQVNKYICFLYVFNCWECIFCKIQMTGRVTCLSRAAYLLTFLFSNDNVEKHFPYFHTESWFPMSKELISGTAPDEKP